MEKQLPRLGLNAVLQQMADRSLRLIIYPANVTPGGDTETSILRAEVFGDFNNYVWEKVDLTRVDRELLPQELWDLHLLQRIQVAAKAYADAENSMIVLKEELAEAEAAVGKAHAHLLGLSLP